jgi:hypothetical protein
MDGASADRSDTGIPSQHPGPTGVRTAEALQRLHRGRLARTVRAQQAEHLTTLHRERQAVDGHGRPVDHPQAVDLYRGVHGLNG